MCHTFKMLICFHIYSWLYKEATVQEVEVMPEDGTARVKVIIGGSAFGRYKNLFPNSEIFMSWNCILFQEKKLISSKGCEINDLLVSLLNSLFFFRTWWFWRILEMDTVSENFYMETIRALSLILSASTRTALNFLC